MRGVRLLTLFAVVALGLSAGAMLTEAVVFVEYWRSLPPAEFLDWFAANEPGLVAFYGPLQTVTLGLALLTTVAHAVPRRDGLAAWAFAAGLSIVVLLLYAVYFKDVNAAFVARSIAIGEVPAELDRWAAWQWVRTGIGTAAFVCGLLAAFRFERSLEIGRPARGAR